jgi:hypothetical protein
MNIFSVLRLCRWNEESKVNTDHNGILYVSSPSGLSIVDILFKMRNPYYKLCL